MSSVFINALLDLLVNLAKLTGLLLTEAVIFERAKVEGQKYLGCSFEQNENLR